MKRFIKMLLPSFCLFTAPLLAAAPWGVMDDYVNPGKKTPPIEKILAGKMVYFFLEQEDGQPTPEPMEQVTNQSLFIRAVNAWPAYVLQQIEQTGRTEEFADLLPLLKQKINLQKTNDRQQADVQVLFSTAPNLKNLCSDVAAGCFVFNELIVVPKIVTHYDKTDNYPEVFRILTHEVGHFFGLADQYYYGADKNASAVHSTTGRIDSDNSLMAYADKLSCDDVDGFINLIDLTLNRVNGHYSPRAQKGWKSFCDETFYKNAKVLNRKDYTTGNRTYKYDAEGNLQEIRYKLPFFYYNSPIKQVNGNRYFMRTMDGDWRFNVFEDEITFESGAHRLSAKRQENKGEVSWDFPFQKWSGSVTLHGDSCSADLSFDTTLIIKAFFDKQEKIYKTNALFWKLTRSDKSAYINTFLTKQGNLLMVNLKSQPAFGQTGVCEWEYDFKPLLTIEQGQIVSTDEENIKKLVQERKIPHAAVLLNSIEVCNKIKEAEQENKIYLQQMSHICKFFRKMEDQFYK